MPTCITISTFKFGMKPLLVNTLVRDRVEWYVYDIYAHFTDMKDNYYGDENGKTAL